MSKESVSSISADECQFKNKITTSASKKSKYYLKDFQDENLDLEFYEFLYNKRLDRQAKKFHNVNLTKRRDIEVQTLCRAEQTKSFIDFLN